MTDKEIAEGLVDALCAHHVITHEYELQTAMIGAKWMQKQMVEKACKLVERGLTELQERHEHEFARHGFRLDIEEGVERFRKAIMEEG